MTITTDALIEQVARRICKLHGLDPDMVYNEHLKTPEWCYYTDEARDAIAAHIALSEIMPPTRATLLAVAGIADALANEAQGSGVDLRERGHVGWADLKSAEATGARRVAVALRDKAGEAGE